MFKFKKYTATVIFTATNGHSYQTNLPFSYLTMRGAERNCRRMARLMMNHRKELRGASFVVEVYEVGAADHKMCGFSIGY